MVLFVPSQATKCALPECIDMFFHKSSHDALVDIGMFLAYYSTLLVISLVRHDGGDASGLSPLGRSRRGVVRFVLLECQILCSFFRYRLLVCARKTICDRAALAFNASPIK